MASGAITGQSHAAKAFSLVEEGGRDEAGVQLLFDFSNVELATASYIKSSVLWFTSCGRMHAGIIDPEELRSLDNTHFKPLNVFPAVGGINPEIEIELQEVFGGRGLACVTATQWTDLAIKHGRVLGKMESTGIRTLRAIADLSGLSEFTAYDLQERFPNERVNATAWNNRLAELHRQRLLRRRKSGKFWKYQTVAEELVYG